MVSDLNPYSTPEALLKELVWPPFQANDCTRWGNDQEDDAQAAFLEYCNPEFSTEAHVHIWVLCLPRKKMVALW